jgi:hypothetical protein
MYNFIEDFFEKVKYSASKIDYIDKRNSIPHERRVSHMNDASIMEMFLKRDENALKELTSTTDFAAILREISCTGVRISRSA